MTLLDRLKKLRDECTPGKWDTAGPDIYPVSADLEIHKFPSRADAELIALQRNHLDDVLALVEAAQDTYDYFRSHNDGYLVGDLKVALEPFLKTRGE